MWQAINPKTFVTQQPARQGTVTTQVGDEETVNTALTPFWKNSNDFYNSADVQSTQRFGFAYPETQKWNFDTDQKYQASVRAAFASLYGGSNLGFILRNSQRGRLSTEAQLKLPSKGSSGASKGPSAMISTIAANVVSAVKHVGAADQKPLQHQEPQHDGASASKPSKDEAGHGIKSTSMSIYINDHHEAQTETDAIRS